MTYLARQCLCCNGTSARTYPAVVAPFLRAYALEGGPRTTTLRECDGCGFRWFEDRLTDAEAERLYAGYRGERYFAARHRAEPWYTRKVNDAIGDSPELLAARRDMVDGFLRQHLDVSTIGDVLDYGGDRGQLIPPVGQRRFVYEISGLTPVAGVGNIASAADLAGRSFDLVLLCHVLEHCSDPQKVLREVAPLLRGEGATLYVELPFERTALRFLGSSERYSRYLEGLGRIAPALTAVDLYSTLFRVRYDVVPPLGFVKMHEHLNFFDESSLRALFASCGLEALVVEKKDMTTPFGQATVLSALARARR
ncbi:MAG: Methyltransferase type 11 [Labilithrix sp.]|nr:Methyltransferase type 11 [Labilithrix sp.]